VQRTADGQVRVHFKKPNRFGATYAQMSPHTFLARLCALVPPPRAHTVLYYGVLSAHHGLGSAVVPHADEPAPEPKQLALFVPRGHVELPATTTLLEAQLRDAAPSRLSWMRLLARVFRIDIFVCARCSGPMKVTRFVTTPEEIAAAWACARTTPAVLGCALNAVGSDCLPVDARRFAPRSARRAWNLAPVSRRSGSDSLFAPYASALPASAAIHARL